MRNLGLTIAALTLIVDRLSKLWLVGYLTDHPFGVEITPFFNLVMVWNTGVSFGLFSGSGDAGRWILSVLALAITVVLTFWLWSARGRLVAVALGLIIGGALSNVIDRLYWGKVADFFDFHMAGHSWPAFNVADSGVVIGVALLLLDSLWPKAGKE